MALTDKEEEILESLWVETVENKKDTCDMSILKDDEAFKGLADQGYLSMGGNLVSLSAKGKREARNCVRRHRLAERLLMDVLDVKKRSVHERSCKFEHLLHEGLAESICTLLGHPKVCPHGRAIPDGRCCREVRKVAGKLIMPLVELEVGKRAIVSYLHTKNRRLLQKLLAMGVLPNTEIVLNQRIPSFVFKIGESQFAVDRELASNIFVRINKS